VHVAQNGNENEIKRKNTNREAENMVDGPNESRHGKERQDIDRNNRFETMGEYTSMKAFI
jgi:hypothetical protein